MSKATIIDGAVRLGLIGCGALAVYGLAEYYRAGGDMFAAPMLAVFGFVGMLALTRILGD